MSHSPPVSCKVYTPRKLADAMVAAVKGDHKAIWLEPGCGKGVFLEALSACRIPRSHIHGIDLDTTPAENDSFAKVLRGVDFLSWASSRLPKFNCIVGNPPYVAIRELMEPLRTTAANVLDHNGNVVGARANVWYSFLQASIRLLDNGGNLAFVLPAACEYADYCESGRASITQFFERVDLIRSNRPMFSDVHEGVAILVCRNKGEHAGMFRRHDVSGLEEAIVRLQDLGKHKARACPKQTASKAGDYVRLGDVMSVKLGGVTGDANYFTMTDSRRRELYLPVTCMQRVLTKCRHIRSPWIAQAEWQALKRQEQRIWLFNPKGSSISNPFVKKYLSLEFNAGGCKQTAYKIINRDPWYRTPMPAVPHGFISGMSSNGLWICINEMSSLNATNTLYVCYFQDQLSNNQRFACALSLLSSEVSKRLRRSRRRYADGLEKIEPGQLSDLELPSFMHIKNAKSLYRKAIHSFLTGDLAQSRMIADSAFRNRE